MGDSYQPGYRRGRNGYNDRDRDPRGRQRDYHESYSHPSERRSYDDRPRSPPRYSHDYNHQPHNHRPPPDQFAFRGAASSQSRHQEPRDAYRPPPDFTFRAQSGASAPLFPPADHYRPAEHNRQDVRGHRGGRGKGGPRGRGGQHGARGNGNRRFVGGFRSKPAHNRAILREAGRSSTPEQLPGMNQLGAARFRDAESTDDDDSSAMDMSSDDEEGDDGPPRKRAMVSMPSSNVVAKWSNPDPYTALPPPESLGAPKKDIVHVIRKAKVSAAPTDTATNAVKENADFISFDFGDNEDDDEDNDENDSNGDIFDIEDGELEENDHHAGDANLNDASRPTYRPSDSDQVGHSSTVKSSDDILDAPISANPAEVVPPSPNAMVMPPDQDLASQYGSIDDLATRLNDASTKRGKKRKHELEAKAQRGMLASSVIQDWQSDRSDPTPWFTGHHRQTHDSKDRLHDEIRDFFTFVQPRLYEEDVRYDLIDRIRRAVRTSRNGANIDIHCFGSFAYGLYLPTADMDLVAVSPGYLRGGRPSFNSKNIMYALKRHLENTGVASPDGVIVVARAKVPVVKFVDRMTGIKVDISFENTTGTAAVSILKQWKREYPAMPVLVVLIKQFLAMRGLNEVFSGGIGGFTIICLVTSMMQHAFDIQVGSMDTGLHYGELLMRFLDLYGIGKPTSFDFETTGIMLNPPRYYNKSEHRVAKQHPNRLTIIDPNDPENDISGGSSQVGTVFSLFRQAHTAIQRRLDQIAAGEDIELSILECILGGNYVSILGQRQKLSILHRGHSITPPPPPPLPAKNQGKPQKLSKKETKTRRQQDKQSRDVHRAPEPQSDQLDTTYKPDDSSSLEFTPINGPSSNGYVYGAPRQRQSTVHETSHNAATITAGHPTQKDSAHREEFSTDAQHRPIANQANEADQRRAAEFRKQFPGAPDIPDALTREQWRELRAVQVASGDQERARTFKAAHPEVAHKIPNSITKPQLRGFNQQFKFHGQGQRKGQKTRSRKQVAKVRARSAARKTGQS
nr:poly(a) rna polymerase protein 1 [Quercus suber]